MDFHLRARVPETVLPFEFCSLKCARDWLDTNGQKYTMTKEPAIQGEKAP